MKPHHLRIQKELKKTKIVSKLINGCIKQIKYEISYFKNEDFERLEMYKRNTCRINTPGMIFNDYVESLEEEKEKWEKLIEDNLIKIKDEINDKKYKTFFLKKVKELLLRYAKNKDSKLLTKEEKEKYNNPNNVSTLIYIDKNVNMAKFFIKNYTYNHLLIEFCNFLDEKIEEVEEEI